MTDHPFVVIGGGLAGLTAAVALAERGHRVTLLEQSRNLGGRAATESRDGFLFNMGPHALYRNGEARRALDAWKIPFAGRVPSVKSGAYVTVDGEVHPFPADPVRMLTTSAFRGFEKLAAVRAFASVMGKARPGESMRQWIDAHTPPARARMLIEALTRVSTYAAQFELLSAEAALRQIRLALSGGVLYLDGGWETLVTGLAEKARSLGVAIETGATVDRLPVHYNGMDVAGTILAVSPAAAEKLTGRALPATTPIHMATLDLAMNSLPPNPAVFALGFDQPLYFSRHTATAKLAARRGDPCREVPPGR